MFLLLKPLRRVLHFMFALAFFCLACVPAALAEEVEWDGDNGQFREVQIGTGKATNALVPGAGSPSDNTVRVQRPGEIPGYVIGGHIHHEDATAAASSGNTVSFSSAATTTGKGVYGGYAYTGSDNSMTTAAGNNVSVIGATITGNVYGGYASNKNNGTCVASNNKVYASRGTGDTPDAGGNVYGGYAKNKLGTSISSDNEVFLTGNMTLQDVCGGSAEVYDSKAEYTESGSATAMQNSVFLQSVTVNYYSYGGKASSRHGLADASENTLVLEKNSRTSWAYGGHSESYNKYSNALRNSVTINGGEATCAVGGLATSTNDGARVEKNSVTINDGAVGKFVKDAGTDSDKPYGYLTGGRATKNGGNPPVKCTADLIAEDNHVYINGGVVKANVHGSYASNAYNTIDSDGIAAATGSSVVISGGEVLGAVFGGYALTWRYVNSKYVPVGVATATNNTVTITGKPEFSDTTTRLYGGSGLGTEGSDFYTNNTLNVLNYTGTTSVAGIANFQNYNFLVPSSLASGSAYLKTGALDMGAAPRLGSVAVTAGRALPDGYKVDLIRSEKDITDHTLATNGKGINEGCKVAQGITIEYDGTVATTEKALQLTLRGGRAVSGTEAIGGGAVGSLIIGVQGSHVLAASGISAARAATKNTDGFSTFVAVEAENSRYHTGSHVDVKGVSALAGLAGKTRIGGGLLIIGPAVEAAYADIEGHIASARGNGHARSFGGALLSRYQHDSGFYLDSSLRAGRTVTNYDSGTLSSGGSATYRLRSPYYGLHLTPGWLWQMTEQTTLDLSASYFWTHVEGSKKTLATGDMVRFEDADSHRLRGGARLSHEAAPGFAPYVGAAYEYELDGDMRADSSGLPFKTLSLHGGYGLGEVGLYWNSGPLFIDAGVQGYTGVREGFGGNLTLRYEF